jgi:hypothetical protein
VGEIYDSDTVGTECSSQLTRDKIRFWYCSYGRHVQFRRLWAIYGWEAKASRALRQSDVESLGNPRADITCKNKFVWPLQLTVRRTPFEDFLC